jgi:hypothetical protein
MYLSTSYLNNSNSLFDKYISAQIVGNYYITYINILKSLTDNF